MVYLDNASITHPIFYRQHLNWFNINSNYSFAERIALTKAEENMRECLNVNNGFFFYFHNASEAIQWLANRPCLYITSITPNEYSHESVVNLVPFWDREDVYVFSRWMYVDQLTNPITGDNVHAIRERTLSCDFIGCDYTASIGHCNLSTDSYSHYDFLFFSAQKFYGETGIAGLWVNDKLGELLGATESIRNQHDLIHGTLDLSGVLMMADAMNYATHKWERENKHYNFCLNLFFKQLNAYNIDYQLLCLNKSTKSSAINAICLKGFNANALQSYLAEKEIYVGLGHSACAENDDYYILEKMGFSKKQARETIRISFGSDNTILDMIDLAKGINEFKEEFLNESN